MYEEFFIAVYTNEVKKYCDSKFFINLGVLNLINSTVSICDNSPDEQYTTRLKAISPTGSKVCRVDVDPEPKSSLFQRNVLTSLIELRRQFLESNCKYFVTIESDVYPHDIQLLKRFLEVVDKADVIGGLYYKGFHKEEALSYQNEELDYTPHVLSGCTLYKRSVIEACPFRWDETLRGAFPDALISWDAARHGFRCANYNKIKCDHLHADNGGRGQELL